MILRTYPLRDAPGVRRAAALGPHFERHLVMLQLQVPVHAGHLQRRRARHAAELPPFPTRPRNQEHIAIYIYIYSKASYYFLCFTLIISCFEF